MFTKTIATAAIAASALGVAGLTAASASAATHRVQVTTATTQVKNRPDSGGNGYWANDKLARTLILTYEGKTGPAGFPYAYTAQLSDKGTFLDKPGQFTPNQGGRDLGKILRPVQVSGTVTGTGYFAEFFSSVKAHSPRTYLNLGVPIRENDHGVTTLPGFNPSSTWPALAFPATATFSASAPLNEIQFSYVYTVPAYTTTHVVNGHKVVVHHKAQIWTDASWNDGGQIPSAGNILGR